MTDTAKELAERLRGKADEIEHNVGAEHAPSWSEIDLMREAADFLSAQEGMQLVPKEPTDDQIEAMRRGLPIHMTLGRAWLRAIYGWAISAAPPAAQEGMQLAVKPLEWRSGKTGMFHHADCILGIYEVWGGGTEWCWRRQLVASPADGVKASEREAKAAAQADYEQRILSALSAAPPAAQEGMQLAVDDTRFEIERLVGLLEPFCKRPDDYRPFAHGTMHKKAVQLFERLQGAKPTPQLPRSLGSRQAFDISSGTFVPAAPFAEGYEPPSSTGQAGGEPDYHERHQVMEMAEAERAGLIEALKEAPPADTLIQYSDGTVGALMFHYLAGDERCDLIVDANGFEARYLALTDDLHDDHPLVKDQEEGGCAWMREWRPPVPDGWKMGATYDTEDGAYAMFIRPKIDAAPSVTGGAHG